MRYLIQILAPQHDSFVLGTYTKIGCSFWGIHPVGSIINANQIGDNFVIRNNTVIGNGNGGKPTLGDNINLGVNVVIIGNIRIGNNVVIGAGSIVTKDIPDNCVVVGNPARILKQNGVRVEKKI